MIPRWLIETLVEITVWISGALLALIVTVAYAFSWFANGGATVSEPFDPVAQVVFTCLWLGMLAAIWFGTRKLLSLIS